MTDDTPMADEGANGAGSSKPRLNRKVIFYVALALVGVALALALTRLRPLFTKRGEKLDAAEAVEGGPLAGFTLEPYYRVLKFKRPLHLEEVPTGGTFWILEQQGRIRAVKKGDPTADRAKVVLDIRDRVTRAGNEEGLLGLAFHPKFATNKTFYVYYSAKERGPRSVVAKFLLRGDGTADPAGEQVVLEVKQPYRNHNGGCIGFGPDGMLYIGLGDGGWAGDPKDHGLNKNTLLGSILRIDVDRTEGDRAYAIPKDNPFTGDAEARGEVWAYGLRNPWRFAFDRDTGELWTGDVGQNAWEEVHLVVRGGNHGWRAYEGFAVYNEADLGRASDHVAPLAAYGRGEGISITGGFVYRGKRFPELRGRYIYGDFQSGAVWALTREPDAPARLDHPRHPTAKGVTVTKLIKSGPPIASFGQDAEGELYVCSFDGTIYALARGTAKKPAAVAFPPTLSALGIYATLDPPRPDAAAIEYAVNVPQWIDGAEVSRFLVLPKGKLLGYRADRPWSLPEGALLAQTISVEGRAVETRVVRRSGGGFALASYAWNADGRDARRVDDGSDIEVAVKDRSTGRTIRRPWRLMSGAECRGCHTRAAGVVLGLRTEQVHHGKQIADWIGSRRFASDAQPPDGKLPRWSAPDGKAPLDRRARDWLAASCAHCHMPGATGNASIDLRASTPLNKTGLLEVAVQHGLGLGPTAKLIEPGKPERSVVYLRVAREDPKRAMPPAGATLPDPRGLELLRSWIGSLKSE